eukprot:1815641-Amphidinium_carterae.1
MKTARPLAGVPTLEFYAVYVGLALLVAQSKQSSHRAYPQTPCQTSTQKLTSWSEAYEAVLVFCFST